LSTIFNKQKLYLMETVLITGGTGFLGRNLAVRMKNDYNVILSGRSNSLNDYARKATDCHVVPMDITNMDAVREVLATYKPTVIIHAAATKYVDLAELYPNECITVNVRGSQNIALAAMEMGVKTVIGISTDKAAPPCTGIYSISKSLMEKLFIRLNERAGTKFCCLRFGNIAWSTGSVFPAWKEMIEKENKIKTTGANMRRFIIPVQEAAQIILDALTNIDSVAGSVLTKKMKSVRIGDILPFFVNKYGCSFEQAAPRIGDKIDEIIIGNAELAYTHDISLNNTPYYLINDEKRKTAPLSSSIDTSTAERLSDEEILSLISPEAGMLL